MEENTRDLFGLPSQTLRALTKIVIGCNKRKALGKVVSERNEYHTPGGPSWRWQCNDCIWAPENWASGNTGVTSKVLFSLNSALIDLLTGSREGNWAKWGRISIEAFLSQLGERVMKSLSESVYAGLAAFSVGRRGEPLKLINIGSVWQLSAS